jgi:hypothetical protein
VTAPVVHRDDAAGGAAMVNGGSLRFS